MVSNETVMVQDVEQAVKQNGFVPLRTRTDELLIISIERAFEMFGEDCSRALLYQLCTMHKMSHEELLSRYDLIERSLRTVFGFGSDAIITYIRANFVKSADIPDSGGPFADLLKSAKEKEIVEFISCLPADRRVALVHLGKDLAQRLKGSLAGSRDSKDVEFYGSLRGIDSEQFLRMCKTHSHVVLGDSLVVYRKADDGIAKI